MAYDVFISYPHQDKAVADAACAKLEAAGIRSWIAPRDVPFGADWGAAIIDAIANAKLMVVILSGHANASMQIKREVERAVSKGIPIIPVRIEDVPMSKSLEYFLSTQHWLDALTPPLERHLEKLALSIEALLQTAPTAQPIQHKAATAGAANKALDRPHDRRIGVKRAILGACAIAAIAAAVLIGFWFLNLSPPKNDRTTLAPENDVAHRSLYCSWPNDIASVAVDIDYVTNRVTFKLQGEQPMTATGKITDQDITWSAPAPANRMGKGYSSTPVYFRINRIRGVLVTCGGLRADDDPACSDPQPCVPRKPVF